MKQDITFYNILRKHFIKDTITPYMKIITNFGGATCLITITILLLIIVKNKKIGLLTLTNLVTISILNQILKSILRRPRPTEFRLINETGYSFPSGHSMVSMAFYGFLIYLIYKNIKNKYLKTILIIILSLLIIAIGISRIYLGVHYVSDIIGGFLISISYLILYIKLINKKL
jgi:undecaprenyl-diphosphatase